MQNRLLAGLVCLALLPSAPAFADLYAGPETFTATGTLAMGAGGNCTAILTATGSPSGATFEIDGSSDQFGAATTTWTALQANTTGTTTMVTSMSGIGKWAVNIAGMTQVRVNLTALSSGSITFTLDAGQGCGLLKTY